MEKSTSIKEIATALSKFQSKVDPVLKDATNPFFKSKYATLENVIAAIRQPLEEQGLSFSQFPSGENELVTILMHTSGEFMQASVKMTPKENSPQAQGSAITYMRRYALSSILGLATEEDDDGNSASKPKATPAPVVKAPAKKPSLKAQIFEKLKKINPDVNKENVQEIVLELTKLDIKDEKNFGEIDGRLTVILSEQQ